MAAKTAKKAAAKDKTSAKRAKTGAKRRQTRARVGPRGIITKLDASTPAKAMEWLLQSARTAMAGGRGVRSTAADDVDAYPLIAAACRPWAAELKRWGVPPNLILGAGLLCDKLRAMDKEEPEAGAPSLTVAKTAALLGRRRRALNRLLPGPSNAKARKAFGLNAPLNPASPATVIAAAKGIISGANNATNTLAEDYIPASDVKFFTAQVKAIKAEQSQAATQRKAITRQATSLDIHTVALEIFYDKFGAGMDGVVADEVALLDALKLIPRREERRGKSEDGGGTGGGGGSGP